MGDNAKEERFSNDFKEAIVAIFQFGKSTHFELITKK